ncbi:STAS domain-containing protein [Streptomyces goshikiensis]|uniref:STAS domain-containing protein n=1 Tax=Streptomyces goshikiensis TaxID=1942 RepID=UPI0036ADC9CC
MNDAILVTMSNDPKGTVITVTGELDMHTCPALRQATITATASHTALHLDLAGVPFMDVTALHLLLDLRHDFQQRGVPLDISGYQRQPTRLLTLTSSRHLLPHAQPVEAARRVCAELARTVSLVTTPLAG